MEHVPTRPVMNARKVARRVICNLELEKVSVFVCVRVHAGALVLERACMSASSLHKTYIHCCHSSGPLVLVSHLSPSGECHTTLPFTGLYSVMMDLGEVR